MGKKTTNAPYKRSSEILLEMTQNKRLEACFTYGAVVQVLGERGFGLALLFFALPSALPFSTIPGISFIFSIPIAIFAVQMIFARPSLWLPKIIADKPISPEILFKIIHYTVPYLVRLERLLQPRWKWITCRNVEIINGIFIVLLAILLMLPIPFSNIIISSIIIVFSLGIIEKDGFFIFLAYALSIFYVILVFSMVWIGINFMTL